MYLNIRKQIKSSIVEKCISESENRKEKKTNTNVTNEQRRNMPTFINISHLIIGINLNYILSYYLHPKFCINVWCQLITYAHFVFSFTMLTKYFNWKVCNKKFLWRIAPQTRETGKICIIHKYSLYSLFYNGSLPWLEIKSKILGKPKKLSILIH